MKNRRAFVGIALFALLAGCNTGNQSGDQSASQSRGVSEDIPKDEIVTVQKRSAQDEQWEYLVVSFGKTTFGDIEENIPNGESKLAAFQEFSTLLAGFEALDLQKKMDILGRFGWEAIELVGQIGGDQQIVFKRARRPDRVAAEQKLVTKLSSILKEEAADKQAKLKALSRELAVSRDSSGELVELDAKEKRDREEVVRANLETALSEIMKSFGPNLTGGLTLKGHSLDLAAREIRTGRTVVRGSMTLDLDGTTALKTANAYRLSEANRLLDEALAQFRKQPGIERARGYSWDNLEVSANMHIEHGGRGYVVAKDQQNFRVTGFDYSD